MSTPLERREVMVGVTFEYITTNFGPQEYTAILPEALAQALYSPPHSHVRVKWPKDGLAKSRSTIVSADAPVDTSVQDGDEPELPRYQYLPPHPEMVAHERPYSWEEFVEKNDRLSNQGYELVHVGTHPQSGSTRAVWKRVRFG